MAWNKKTDAKNIIENLLKASVAISSCALLFACGGDSGSSGSPEKVEFVSSVDDLEACSDDLEGDSVFVKDEKSDFVCTKGKWINADSLDSHVQEINKEESSSSVQSDSGESSSSVDKTNSSSSDKESSSSVALSSSSVKDEIEKSSDSHIGESSSSDNADNILLDSRDGQTYRTVTIGSQTWMAENLNYSVDSSWCYDDDPVNCAAYGRLYSWNAAMEVCPENWHLPTYDEWDSLIKTVGGSESADKTLKSVSGWMIDADGTDTYAFTALPAGIRQGAYENYYGSSHITFFWSASKICDGSYDECTVYEAYGVGWSEWWWTGLNGESGSHVNFTGLTEVNSTNGNSVRCIKGPAKVLSPSVISEVTQGYMTDGRDGQNYKTVTIGSQTWMAENLNYETDSSWCYNDEVSNCASYGRFYSWNAAMTACPKKWHLPTPGEWMDLFEAVGGQHIAAKVLKSTTGWEDDGNGSDAFGFSALPVGGRDFGDYSSIGYNAYFWTSSGNNSSYANYICLKNYKDFPCLIDEFKGSGFSVRCLKDVD